MQLGRKILVTGTFCSGKTTLASDIYEEIKDAILIPEITRELLHLYGKIDWSMPEVRDYLIVRQLFLEKKASQEFYPCIIIDSGIVSNLAHDIVLGASLDGRKEIIRTLEHSPYDIVFLCDHTEIELLDDGQRYIDKGLQDTLAHKIVETLSYLDYHTWVRVQGSERERLSFALETIFTRGGRYDGEPEA